MIRFTAITLLLASTLALPGIARAAEAVSRYTYAEHEVYTVRAGLGIATAIELDPADPVLDYSSGFSSGWEIVRREHVFYLKPRNLDVDTNLLVRTQRRAYIFELQVVATDWRRLEDARRRGAQYRIVFEYPGAEEPEVVADGDAEEAPMAVAKPWHYDYDIATRTRRDWLLPTAVYDDGALTYIRLPNPGNIPSGNWPTVFGRNARHDEDFVVNSSIEGDTIVVHGVYPFLVLRHGAETVGLRRNPVE